MPASAPVAACSSRLGSGLSCHTIGMARPPRQPRDTTPGGRRGRVSGKLASQRKANPKPPAPKAASKPTPVQETKLPRPPRPPAKPKAPREEERLHVRIARSGLCSRRAAEQLILEGRVTVNGELVSQMGVKVKDDDEVAVDGVIASVAKIYTLVLNKPTGVVTTLRDPQGRPTIVKFLPDVGVQLKPVGRLDMDTEGVLICTNDGELANRLAHPRYGVEKEYQAVVEGIPEEKSIEKLRKGIWIEGGKTSAAIVDVIHSEAKRNTTGFRLIIHEGRKRQVRLMMDAIGHPVISLKRVRYAMLRVKGMRSGEARMLGKHEVDELRRIVGL